MNVEDFITNCQDQNFENEFNLEIHIVDPFGLVIPKQNLLKLNTNLEEVGVQARS